MSFSLRDFDLHEMLHCGLALRRAIQGEATMEEAAGRVVRYLYDECLDPESGARECALVRFYKTHSYGELEPGLQAFARERLGGREPRPEMKCLVLLASAGDEPGWNSRRHSRGHQAIPLPSPEIVEQAPMIAELIRGMGLDVEAVVTPRPGLVRGMEDRTYNVFFVPEALDSPFIPAQADFVRPHGIRSVLGFGGLLLTGELYAVIAFTRVPVPPGSADRFRNIALDLKVAISPLAGDLTFAAHAGVEPENSAAPLP
ncbi:MAG: hypothetical protein JO040_09105 [Gemmatimonadetes bacterium]|nr:hypothetical protein [Gemmatimonadota bacterium]